MIRSIAGDEPADEVGANVELLEDFPARSKLDALAVLGGKHDLSLCKLFGIEFCALFGIIAPFGKAPWTLAEGRNRQASVAYHKDEFRAQGHSNRIVSDRER
jgi:hypothetical protein